MNIISWYKNAQRDQEATIPLVAITYREKLCRVYHLLPNVCICDQLRSFSAKLTTLLH